ncbi:MAG: DUF4321 domain-containing protein [Ruminococcus sp.]|nr:DUF4321 domain-containing protein [Ruminococcus sp.]
MKKTFAFIFFTLSAIVLGAFIAYLCKDISFLSWLAWGKQLGFENFSLDLYVISFSVSAGVNFTISQLITIPIALIVYARTCKGLN